MPPGCGEEQQFAWTDLKGLPRHFGERYAVLGGGIRNVDWAEVHEGGGEFVARPAQLFTVLWRDHRPLLSTVELSEQVVGTVEV